MAELPEQAAARIAAIAADREHGALEIARDAVDVFRTLAARPDLVPEAARRLCASQPAMAPLVVLARRIAANPRRVAETCEEAARDLERSARSLAETAAALLADGCRVLTHSSSSAVREAILEAARAGRRVRVTATRSLPLGEGERLATALRRAGIEVRLIEDAEIARAMREADLAMVGADWVSPTVVVNKVGTALVALAARAYGRPCYALAGSWKFAGEEPPEPGPLFEAVPRDWVTVVSETPAG